MVNILPLNHWLFQLASLLLCLSYVQAGLIYLRLVLILASVCLVTWAWFILNVAIDAVLWNSLQICINSVMLGMLFYERLPISFDQLTEEVYMRVFASVWCPRFSRKELNVRGKMRGAHSLLQSAFFVHSLDEKETRLKGWRC